MALIEAESVHVRFGDRVVLEEIDLAVPEANSRHDGPELLRQDASSTC